MKLNLKNNKMKIKKAIFLIVFIISSTLISNAQLVDNYGLKFGYGISNQHWSYQNEILADLSGWKGNKNSFTTQIFAEKSIGRSFAINYGLGYFQNGFTEQVDLTFYSGETAKIINDKVSFHNLSLDLNFKYKLTSTPIQTYLYAGLNSNYLIDYKSAVVEYQGAEYNLDTEIYDDFNKISLSGTIGFGLSFNNIFFVELEYKPAITNNLNTQYLKIKSRYFGITIGVNINSFFDNTNE